MTGLRKIELIAIEVRSYAERVVTAEKFLQWHVELLDACADAKKEADNYAKTSYELGESRARKNS